MVKKILKKPNILFGFFYQYWISIILLVMLITLVRQNFFINQFPFVLHDKQEQIQQHQQQNRLITQHNQQLEAELTSLGQTNMELIESSARYKFGLIKDGELFYRVSRLKKEQD